MAIGNPSFPFDAILFDAARTLLRPNPSVGAVYAAIASRHGYSATDAALDAGFRAALRERLPVRFGGDPARRTSNAAEKAWWRGTVARTFELAGLTPPGEACFEALFDGFADPAAWRLFDDVLPALTAFRRAGLRLGIVSNFDSRLRRICAGLGLAEAVDFVLVSAEVGFAKPARQIFDAALRAAGTPPGRTLMVGDSPEDDVAGAEAAGCQALLIDRAGRHAGQAAIRDLREICSSLP